MGRNFHFLNISAKNGTRALKTFRHMYLIQTHPNIKFDDDPDHNLDLMIQKHLKNLPSLKLDRGFNFAAIVFKFEIYIPKYNISNISYVFSFLICRSLAISDEIEVLS